MKIITETGSIYDIDGNLCRKYRDGEIVDSFKVFFMRSIPSTVKDLPEIYDLPESEPKVGERLYLAGRNNWWISTRVERIEY
jgi:hypothetical protein